MKQHRSILRFHSILALLFAVAFLPLFLIAIPISASAQTSLSQCNGTDNVGGQAVECHYKVTNNLNGSATSSTVTLTECHGLANAPPTMICTSSTTSSDDLVTAIDQCNGSGNGGGGTVTCTVEVINNITARATATAATVNQCNESGTGGGTAPTVLCDPFPATTTGATVTQCNGSGNGGGGTQRVQCTVDSDSTTTALLTVTINQCNGSGNGGGAKVTCRAGLTNNITAPSTGGDHGASGAGGGGSDGTSGSDGGGSGSNGGTSGGGGNGMGDGTGSGDSSSGQVIRVPAGGAATGGGSASGLENTTLLLLGMAFLAAAVPALLIRGGVGSRRNHLTWMSLKKHSTARRWGGLLAIAAAVVGIVGRLSLIGVALTSHESGVQLPAAGGGPGSTLARAIISDAWLNKTLPAKKPMPLMGASSASDVVGPTMARSKPVALDIPAIDVHSDLQDLGLESDGALEVPAGPNYDEAAWYRYSPTPGSLGPAVLLGHIDSASNGPSVFFRLGELKAGDQVSVTRTDGSVAIFIVDKVRSYPKDDFPTELVYGDIDHAGLRILTCGGEFDDAAGHYLNNVVVFASLR